MSSPWPSVDRMMRVVNKVNRDELTQSIAWFERQAKESPYLGVRESCQLAVEVMQAVQKYRGPEAGDTLHKAPEES